MKSRAAAAEAASAEQGVVSAPMVDLHSHLIPGVDDGAGDADQARVALAAMITQGVEGLVVTPHLGADLTLMPGRLSRRLEEIDSGFEVLRRIAAEEHPPFRLERGAEVLLDTPRPDFSDPRLRLAGTDFVLVEFAGFMVPPRSAEVLRAITEQGYRPVLAHPERYAFHSFDQVVAWREAGALLQVNAGSILGMYGEKAKEWARKILSEGFGDYVASDFHCRGEPALEQFSRLLEQLLADGQLMRLTNENPRLLLEGKDPLPVDPILFRQRRWFGLKWA